VATSGSTSTPTLTATTPFGLTCTGAGGPATQSVTVTVGATTGTATLSWSAPTTNTDGTPVTTLIGYHIYYGTVQPDPANPGSNCVVTTTFGARFIENRTKKPRKDPGF
jgi:hypothetical protein